jgi:hypothetical protein
MLTDRALGLDGIADGRMRGEIIHSRQGRLNK